MKILVATNNPGKRLELQRLLNIEGLELLLPADVGLDDFDVEETGITYLENASLKATGFAQAAKMYAIADDSGLEVSTLNNEPGVYTKRYAGENKTDPERIAFLLEKLKNTPIEQRQARFVALVALAAPDGEILTSQTGYCYGQINFEPRGNNGFGYDPIFLVEGKTGHTMAELSNDEKDEVSHRGNAARAIAPDLKIFLKE
jgi:XTP/dITP diphosphohydrolase